MKALFLHRSSRRIPTCALFLCLACSGKNEPVKLHSGATLDLPPGASLSRTLDPTPPNLHSARLFSLGNGPLVLLVNDMKREGESCQDLLGEALADTGAATSDALASQLYKFHVNERRDIGDVMALYTEGGNRTPEEVAADQPFRDIASFILCKGDTAVGLFLSSEDGTLSDEDREVLRNVAQSFSG